MTRTLSLLSALLLCISSTVAGQPAETPLLSLQQAIALGMERSLDLRAQWLNLPIGQGESEIASARFDPVADAAVGAERLRMPSASSERRPYEQDQAYSAAAGLTKTFHTGLAARLSLETLQLESNAPNLTLDPRYRTIAVLSLTQPLLKDFGVDVNTTDLDLSRNRLRQAEFSYLDRAQRQAEAIELVYLDLARAQQVLAYRIHSRELAQELLEGNQQKFDAGIVPLTEVQEAETAVASRDEQVLLALQQAESTSNQLRDLLELDAGDGRVEAFRTESLPAPKPAWPALEEALRLALEQRPDLQRQRLEIASSNLQLQFFDNQRLPRLDLEATLGANGLAGDSLGGVTASPHAGGYGRTYDRLASGDGYEAFVGLRLAYPLGNRAAEARYRNAGHQQRQAIYGLKRLENAVETELRNALVVVRRSQERIAVAERFERLAETTLQQEMERLREGLSDTFRILDFQDDVIEARVRKTDALVDFNRGLATLYRATGNNLARHGIAVQLDAKELPHARD